MKQIKVLLVSPCQGGYGGIEAFVLAVADAVRRDPGIDLRVIFKKVRSFALKPDLAEMLQHEQVTLVDRAGPELAQAIRWADIVHLQNASPDVIALTKFYQKKIALTIHNYMGRGWSLHRALWRIGARIADARWYNSQFVWNTWEPTRKLRGSRKVPTVSRLPSGWSNPADRKGFTFVGRWIANKGIDTLLEAYASATFDQTRWPLLLMGDGPLRPEIEARIRRENIAAELLGFVDEPTKVQRMQQSKWLVVPPSTNEDFGLTAIEARSLGVPCIITRDGGLPEAGGKHALVCEPRDVRGLTALLERAAAMSEIEYTQLATETRADLQHELEPLSFYPTAYRALVRGEPIL